MIRRERQNPLAGQLAQATNELLGDNAQEIVYVDREVVREVSVEVVKEVEVPVEVQVPTPYPVQTVDGVTWVGNIGMSPTGLVMGNVSPDEWRDFFNVIRDIKSSWQFIVGDWCAYGIDALNMEAEDIAKITGYKVESVKVFASICRNVPKLTRINSLTFAHHRAVAGCDDTQTQSYYLNRAKNEELSARDLVELIRGSRKRLSSGRKNKPKYAVIDRKELRRAQKADAESRAKLAQELRDLADKLERGE